MYEVSIDVFMGLSQAVDAYEAALDKAIALGADPDSIADMMRHQRAAEAWLIHVARA